MIWTVAAARRAESRCLWLMIGKEVSGFILYARPPYWKRGEEETKFNPESVPKKKVIIIIKSARIRMERRGCCSGSLWEKLRSIFCSQGLCVKGKKGNASSTERRLMWHKEGFCFSLLHGAQQLSEGRKTEQETCTTPCRWSRIETRKEIFTQGCAQRSNTVAASGAIYAPLIVTVGAEVRRRKGGRR